MPPCEDEENLSPIDSAHYAIDEAKSRICSTLYNLEDEVDSMRDGIEKDDRCAAAYKSGWAAGVEYAYRLLRLDTDKLDDVIDDEFAKLKDS